jgi:spore maturation protein CgeB
MRVVMFCQSVRSDWNHASAHFVRGVAREFQARGHQVAVFEPRDGWSAANLAREVGAPALELYREAYPTLRPTLYTLDHLDLDRTLAGAQLVLVHDWNAHELIERIGDYRIRSGNFTLLFHDTHHRPCAQPDEIAGLDLSGYDGVLACGEVVREQYLRAGWGDRVWTWHEAADTRVFYPRPEPEHYARSPVVWIGNWGGDERTAELYEFLLNPVRRGGLTGHVYGARYPRNGIAAIERSGLTFDGWLPNHRVARALGDHEVTIHVPRRVFATQLPGIPTIRVFEALACGIPLISAPWDDSEQLFRAGTDYLVARDGARMGLMLRQVRSDRAMATALARAGRRAIEARHTCAHRVNELMGIVRQLVSPMPVHGAA